MKLTRQTYDLACIGNYTKDTIISPAGKRFVDGGGSRYAAFAAHRLGKKVAVVTRLARADEHIVSELIEQGIDCHAVYSPASTLMCLAYPTENPDIRTLTVDATAGTISAAQVENIETRSALIGSSLRGEVGLELITALKQRQVCVGLDVQGYVRVLVGNELKYMPWPEMQTTLAWVDILKSDAVEAEFLTGERDIRKAALIFNSMGPKEIVLTHKDGLLVLAEGEFYDFNFYPQNLSGRSGRGDTCIGTYTAMRLDKTAPEAGRWAAAVTSLKMEKLGPFDRTVKDVETLIKARYNHNSSS